MAADLHIHVFEGITEDDLALFFSSSLGSKHFDLNKQNGGNWLDCCIEVGETPSIWIGEVSWLAAAMLKDAERFVPSPVAKISELIGEGLPVLDEEMVQKIRLALQHDNSTSYKVRAVDSELEEFFKKHMGKKIFKVSW